MARWYSDPGLRRLVKERNAGDLSRREFLARLGGTAAGAAAVSFAGAGPARAQKKIVVTTWDTEPNPSTRAAMKAIVEDFHKLHKDIEVRAEGMGWGDMDRKLQAAMAAKSPPTASHTQTYVVTSFRDKGLIEPVDDIVKAIGEDKIFPSVLRWLKYPDGKYWGITHAWGAEILGGRGDYLAGTGVNPQSWKTWDDWLRDLPKLNKAPQHYGLSLAGIPFFVNEDVYMWTGANGGSLFDAKGQPALESPQVLGMLEFWKKLKPYLPPGWASHDYLETLSAWATGKTAQVLMWGRTAGYIDQYAPPDKRNPDVFQVWPKTHGPMGKAPLTQFDNEPWVIYADAPADEKAACREFLKFFFKPENYRCTSCPSSSPTSRTRATSTIPSASAGSRGSTPSSSGWRWVARIRCSCATPRTCWCRGSATWRRPRSWPTWSWRWWSGARIRRRPPRKRATRSPGTSSGRRRAELGSRRSARRRSGPGGASPA
jgi:multiple sugar transport system substrate-binding protein